ncbi:unnamed protein product [Vitrella brassicaformis CCMP3155]|uniref:Uncharacterized protein n=1 Tax=Vitrella brassicaformis (strain CCMP3155) TaxID=1169540 RepID=A0A0G4H0C1_VITBC|nr:unnamed protein product [Vitrella brassicaformis CCMP3155]|eukprot:CEM36994.1 unnamed protein product [Vitrella brassicaformis CCMP3155]
MPPSSSGCPACLPSSTAVPRARRQQVASRLLPSDCSLVSAEGPRTFLPLQRDLHQVGMECQWSGETVLFSISEDVRPLRSHRKETSTRRKEKNTRWMAWTHYI